MTGLLVDILKQIEKETAINHKYTNKEQFKNTQNRTHTGDTQNESMTTNTRDNISQKNRRVNNGQKDNVNSVQSSRNVEEPI